MKKFNSIFASLLALSAIVGFSFTTLPLADGSYRVDTSSSFVQWKGYKVTGEHAGVVNLKSGDLTFDENGKLTGGNIVMDMTTIKVTDLQGDMAGKLEGHLKSADFFGIEKHPTANLKITSVVPKGTPGDYKVTGTLTIKEKSKDIRFYANVVEDGGRVKATADIKIDRTDFDVRYGSGSFFDGLGDKTIYDEFDLQVTLVASK